MTHDAATLDGVLADRSAWRADQCPIDKALRLVGTRSAMLIMREAYYGTTRFDDFAQRVGITEAVAAARLRELTTAGLLERRPYQDPGQRTRHEYRLTDMGRDLAPAVLALFDWGAKYLSPGGKPPVNLSHTGCGAPLTVGTRCTKHHLVDVDQITVSAPAAAHRESPESPSGTANVPRSFTGSRRSASRSSR